MSVDNDYAPFGFETVPPLRKVYHNFFLPRAKKRINELESLCPLILERMYSNYHNEYVLTKLPGFYPPSLCVNYDHKERPKKINLIVRNDLFLFLRVTLTWSDACVAM